MRDNALNLRQIDVDHALEERGEYDPSEDPLAEAYVQRPDAALEEIVYEVELVLDLADRICEGGQVGGRGGGGYFGYVRDVLVEPSDEHGEK